MNRIKELRKSKGMSGADLSKAIGYSASYLYDIEKGKKRLNTDVINKLACFFGVSSDYLLGLDSDDNAVNYVTSANSGIIRLPIFDSIDKDTPTDLFELFDTGIAEREGKMINDYFYMRIKGNSMEPNLKNNDIVLISQQSEAENGQLAVILFKDTKEAQCKRVTISGNTIILNSDNSEYAPIVYNKKQHKIVGIIIALIRRNY